MVIFDEMSDLGSDLSAFPSHNQHLADGPAEKCQSHIQRRQRQARHGDTEGQSVYAPAGVFIMASLGDTNTRQLAGDS